MTLSSITAAVTFLAAGLSLLGDAKAQQAPASNTQSTTTTNSQQAPAAKTPTTPAAKSTQAAGSKTTQGTAKKSSAAPLTLKTQKEKASYAIGMNIGRSMKHDSVEIDPNVLVRGIKDALADGKMLLTDEEAKAAIGALQAELQKKRQDKLKEMAEANKKEGEAFLAANKTKEGVIALPSGLQYKVLTEGTGPKPTASDSVVCNYKGTLLNGKEFDSSYKRGQPVTFPVGQVIKGWTEALQLMPVGSKWELYIPSDLAYGERGAGGEIEPNSTLIFDVELLSIQEKTPPPQPGAAQPANPADAKPEAGKPETAKPESEAPKPEGSKSETSKPETAKPETTQPAAVQPGTAKPN